jgi:hypothetical protein
MRILLRRLAWGLSILLVVLGVGGLAWHRHAPAPAAVPEVALPLPAEEATFHEVDAFCGACHAYPPPSSFPREAWRKEVKQGYDFFRASSLRLPVPSLESVALYYEKRAPEHLPWIENAPPPSPPPVSFERQGHRPPGGSHPAVSQVHLAHLFDPKKLDVLVSDLRSGQVWALRPYTKPPEWRALGKLTAPCRIEVVDLDGDGILDLLVADLGEFMPTNEKVGRVVWLRGRADGTFTPITLLENVGRVADVGVADFRGAGKKDLIVAVFGWRNTGEILYLENQTTDWSQPKFTPRVLDDRHGAIHVPVGDLDGDGKPDFVALISQEHETIVAFLNEGGGRFRKETIHRAPHPAWGSSGIQLVDLDGDGKLDVLYTNGDVMDKPYLLKPYHGIQWLKNEGRFPFTHHAIQPMYGVMRALAADFRGVGRKDIVAVSHLPAEHYPQRQALNLDAVVLLEQVAPGKFVRYPLQAGTCDHFSCAVGDLEGNGVQHLVTGVFTLTETRAVDDALVIWRNQRRPHEEREPGTR